MNINDYTHLKRCNLYFDNEKDKDTYILNNIRYLTNLTLLCLDKNIPDDNTKLKDIKY